MNYYFIKNKKLEKFKPAKNLIHKSNNCYPKTLNKESGYLFNNKKSWSWDSKLVLYSLIPFVVVVFWQPKIWVLNLVYMLNIKKCCKKCKL